MTLGAFLVASFLAAGFLVGFFTSFLVGLEKFQAYINQEDT